MAKDKYGQAVEWLSNHPEYIATAWNCAVSEFDNSAVPKGLSKRLYEQSHEKAACLFTNCGDESGKFESNACLTQIAHGTYERAGTPELTKAIKEEAHKIPEDGKAIRKKDLTLFSRWRRRIDKEIAVAKELAEAKKLVKAKEAKAKRAKKLKEKK